MEKQKMTDQEIKLLSDKFKDAFKTVIPAEFLDFNKTGTPEQEARFAKWAEKALPKMREEDKIKFDEITEMLKPENNK